MSANVNVIRDLSQFTADEIMYNYDYLIFLRESEETKKILEEIDGKLEGNVIKINKESSDINSNT